MAEQLLPVVTRNTLLALLQDMEDRVGDLGNLIFRWNSVMEKENPELIQHIRDFAKRENEPDLVIFGALLTYSTLRAQAESDNIPML